MIGFSRKPISTIEPLGEKLRQARQAARLPLNTVALQTGIPLKYLDALERSRYQELPSDVYVKNFLRIISQILHLSLERVLELYERERRVAGNHQAPTPPTALSEPRVVNISKLARNIVFALGVAGLLFYLGLKVQKVIEAPLLTLSSPAQDFVTATPSVLVEGTTEAESAVRINGQEVFLTTGGNFSERIDLQPGLNVIKVSATKERSREQVVFRQVIVEESTPIETSTGTQP